VGRRRWKHVPHRTCVACRKKIDKRQLTRIVRTVDEGIIIDPTGKKNGRGAYLCNDPECWEMAINTPLLSKALRVTISAEEKETLRQHRFTIDEVSPAESVGQNA
jgi:hypothetical protein